MMADLAESRVLAFDVGGSHVAAAVCRGKDFRLGPVVSAPHAAAQTSNAFVDLLHELGVKAGACGDGTMGAMLAVPGPFDLKAGVSLMRHKLPFLYGIDLRQALAARFGWQPSANTLSKRCRCVSAGRDRRRGGTRFPTRRGTHAGHGNRLGVCGGWPFGDRRAWRPQRRRDLEPSLPGRNRGGLCFGQSDRGELRAANRIEARSG